MKMKMDVEVKREREREREIRKGRRNSWTSRQKAGVHGFIGWQTMVGTSPNPTQFFCFFRLSPLPCIPRQEQGQGLVVGVVLHSTCVQSMDFLVFFLAFFLSLSLSLCVCVCVI